MALFALFSNTYLGHVVFKSGSLIGCKQFNSWIELIWIELKGFWRQFELNWFEMGMNWIEMQDFAKIWNSKIEYFNTTFIRTNETKLSMQSSEKRVKTSFCAPLVPFFLEFGYKNVVSKRCFKTSKILELNWNSWWIELNWLVRNLDLNWIELMTLVNWIELNFENLELLQLCHTDPPMVHLHKNIQLAIQKNSLLSYSL